jgi:hypothetical protein
MKAPITPTTALAAVCVLALTGAGADASTVVDAPPGLDQMIGQMLIVGHPGPAPGPDDPVTRDIALTGLGGVILPKSRPEWAAELQTWADIPLLVVEGGGKGKLGLKGVTVSEDLQTSAVTARHGLKEAIRKAVLSGSDMLRFGNLRGYDPAIARESAAILRAMVDDGTIPLSRIESSWRRISALKKRSSSSAGLAGGWSAMALDDPTAVEAFGFLKEEIARTRGVDVLVPEKARVQVVAGLNVRMLLRRSDGTSAGYIDATVYLDLGGGRTLTAIRD